jgi:hypothetical protein
MHIYIFFLFTSAAFKSSGFFLDIWFTLQHEANIHIFNGIHSCVHTDVQGSVEDAVF